MRSTIDLNPRLESSRLCIRQIEADDAQAVFDSYASKPALAYYLSWAAHQEISETLRFIHHARRQWVMRTEFTYVLIHAETDALIGSIGVTNEAGRMSIGYVLNEAYQRQGYTHEAVERLVEHLKEFPEVYRIWALTHEKNQPSQGVLQKAGFVFEGVVDGWVRFPNIGNEAAKCHFFCHPLKA